jgi:ATP-dependent DNA helicase RecQ
VADVCRANDLTMDNALTGVAPTRPRAQRATSEEYFPYFKVGKSIAEVAGLMQKTESTVREHLCAYILAERPNGIETWVPRDTVARIAAAARVHGTQRMKPVFVALNEQVPYDAIAVTFAYLNSRSEGEVAVESDE